MTMAISHLCFSFPQTGDQISFTSVMPRPFRFRSRNCLFSSSFVMFDQNSVTFFVTHRREKMFLFFLSECGWRQEVYIRLVFVVVFWKFNHHWVVLTFLLFTVFPWWTIIIVNGLKCGSWYNIEMNLQLAGVREHMEPYMECSFIQV